MGLVVRSINPRLASVLSDIIKPMNGRVLLLNASYVPICAVSMKRAVVLVLAEKAEVVSAGADSIRSESLWLDAPTVIRLIRYVNVPHFRKAYLSRRTILARDNHECCYCGKRANTMDHVMPRSRGGQHTWTNVVACCYNCNQEKDDRTPQEMGWSMRYPAAEPEGVRRIVLIVGTVHPAWDEWLQVA